MQVATLWAVQNEFFDKVPVDKVKDFQNKLVDQLKLRNESTLVAIREKGALDDALIGQLKEAIGAFADSYQA